MSLVERSDAVEEIYNSVKPRRVGRAALQGATFGLSDEAIAAASSPKAALAAAVAILENRQLSEVVLDK